MREPLDTRRAVLEKHVLPKLDEPIRYSQELKASLSDLIAAVKAQGFEGLVAKRRSSRYEPGKRSGAWQKMRVNRSQNSVIGGYTVGGSTFDALIFGYYEGNRLMYAARTRKALFKRSELDAFMKRHLEAPADVDLERIADDAVESILR